MGHRELDATSGNPLLSLYPPPVRVLGEMGDGWEGANHTTRLWLLDFRSQPPDHVQRAKVIF